MWCSAGSSTSSWRGRAPPGDPEADRAVRAHRQQQIEAPLAQGIAEFVPEGIVAGSSSSSGNRATGCCRRDCQFRDGFG